MPYLTDEELLERFEFYTLQIEEQLIGGEDLETIGDQIPFALQINNSETLEFIYSNKKHAELAGHHIDEILELGPEYIEKNVHPASMDFISQTLPLAYAQMSSHHTFFFIQHAKTYKEDRYTPVITFTKPANAPDGLLISILPSIKQFGKHAKKMEQVIKIDEFKLKHFKRFQQLTEREVEIIALLANGYNNPQIADRLFISRSTVETHRKNLKRKLKLRSFRDLMKYAFAFDLVEV